MTSEPTGPERLHKVMARAGIASRRVCEDMIEEGRVEVNGVRATLGQKVNTSTDEIRVDGSVTLVDPTRVTYLLNKPIDVLSSASDPHGRTCVVDLVTPENPDIRLYPIGRLDMDSEGLLLLTNDGALTHLLTHPSFGVDKEYLVSVDGSPSRAALRSLREGVDLDDGMTAPAKVSELSPGLLRFIIHEGRNRQIRRMCEHVGHQVERLVRTRIGPLSDRRLKSGEWRELTTDEVHELYRAAGPSGDG